MKKNKILIILISIISVTIVLIIMLVGLKNNKQPVNVYRENEIVQVKPEIKITGKLLEYINSLTNNYYIKYSGKFKDENGKLVETIVDFSKDNEKFALQSTDINMHLVCNGEKLYSISNVYKMIVQMAKESFVIDEYNLASDIGQTFVKSYKDKIYDVEEYKYNDNVLKYYFQDNDLKLINYNGNEIKIIRLEKKTNKELFQMPKNYSYTIV